MLNEKLKYSINPLEGFSTKPIIKNVAGIDFSITNMTLFLIVVFLVILFFFLNTTYCNTLIPNRWQALLENMFQFVLNMVYRNIGKRGLLYLNLVFVYLVVLLFLNFLGLSPYSLSLTGQVIITLSMALAIFIGVIFIGIVTHHRFLLSSFFPKGSPLLLAPLLVIIEVVLYFFRPLSLAIRLFANMMAGHTLLSLGILYTHTMLCVRTLLSFTIILTTILLLAFMGLETGVAGLQAYVFTLLVCFYINDAINLSH